MSKKILKVHYMGKGCTEKDQIQNAAQFIRGLKEATGLSFSDPGGYNRPLDGKPMIHRSIETDSEDSLERLMKYGSQFGDKLDLRVDEYSYERKRANYQADCD